MRVPWITACGSPSQGHCTAQAAGYRGTSVLPCSECGQSVCNPALSFGCVHTQMKMVLLTNQALVLSKLKHWSKAVAMATEVRSHPPSATRLCCRLEACMSPSHDVTPSPPGTRRLFNWTLATRHSLCRPTRPSFDELRCVSRECLVTLVWALTNPSLCPGCVPPGSCCQRPLQGRLP